MALKFKPKSLEKFQSEGYTVTLDNFEFDTTEYIQPNPIKKTTTKFSVNLNDDVTISGEIAPYLERLNFFLFNVRQFKIDYKLKAFDIDNSKLLEEISRKDIGNSFTAIREGKHSVRVDAYFKNIITARKVLIKGTVTFKIIFQGTILQLKNDSFFKIKQEAFQYLLEKESNFTLLCAEVKKFTSTKFFLVLLVMFSKP